MLHPPASRTRHVRLRLIAAAAALLGGALILLPAGCNILAPASYFIGGVPKVYAEYDLQQRPTVVFVDDRANVIGASARPLRLAIADKITSTLIAKNVLPAELMISPRDAMGIVLARDRHSEPMAIDAIGRDVGAEQLIYVEMIAFRKWAVDRDTPQPVAGCNVRVIDVTNQRRVFPDATATAESARPVYASLPPLDPSVFQSAASSLKVFQQLAEVTGAEVAKLFYTHDSTEVGGNLNPH